MNKKFKFIDLTSLIVEKLIKSKFTIRELETFRIILLKNKDLSCDKLQSILVYMLPNKKLNYFFEAIDFKNWFTNEFIEFLDTACEVILMKQLLTESHNMFLNKTKPWMLNNQNNLHKYVLLVFNTNDKSFIFQNTNDVLKTLKTKLSKWSKINIDMRLYSNFDFKTKLDNLL